MKLWVRTSLVLCVFGFLKEFRPSEPYVTQYLVGPWKNFTDTEVNQQIYPVSTYSYLSQLILVFLLTDLLRYKVVIVLEGICGVVGMVLLMYGTDIPVLQTMSFFTGTFFATEIAYFTYIYAKVDRKYFQKVTSYTQSAFLMGRFLSSVTGQILVSMKILDYHGLNFVTTGALVLATAWSLFLPSVKASVYFHNEAIRVPSEDNQASEKEIPPSLEFDLTPTFLNKCKRAYKLLWTDFKEAYTNWYVLKWSIWWALAACGFNQGYFYVQILWENVAIESGASEHELHSMYNAGVEAVYTMIGAATAFACGWLRLNWAVLGEATLAGCAILQGAALIVAAHATDIWVAYLGFVVFGVLFHTMFTIVNAEVAKHINEDSYGLIFGVNTFFAIVFQTILTVLVAGEGGMELGIRTQFEVYGGYFVVLGSLFAVIAVVNCSRCNLRKETLWLPIHQEPVHT